MHLGFRGGRRCGPPERIRRDCRTTFTTAGILRSCGYGYKSLYAVEVWYGPATMGGRGALEHGTPGMIFIANQPCRLVTIKRMIRVPNTEIGGTWKWQEHKQKSQNITWHVSHPDLTDPSRGQKLPQETPPHPFGRCVITVPTPTHLRGKGWHCLKRRNRTDGFVIETLSGRSSIATGGAVWGFGVRDRCDTLVCPSSPRSSSGEGGKPATKLAMQLARPACHANDQQCAPARRKEKSSG